MALSDAFLQDLKMKTDINDIISSYVSLKRRGNTSVGLCPFHNEKTPSFTVYEDTQSFYCFGCGAGGDAIGFIKRIENLDYIDAVKTLAQRAGIQMPDEGYDDSLAKKRRRILELNRATAKFYHNFLMSDDGRIGLDYFLNRGLTKKTINHFGLGYAPNNWDLLLKHLKSEGFTISEMIEAGVVKKGNKGYYDIFRNRVMTPIIDVRGNVIAFGGRVLDDSKPKYINTADTLVYKKTNELFALNYAKDSGDEALILCEGYMDVIAMHQAGFTNAVAGCGTALTSEQVRLVSRYAKSVILAYDCDEAGQKALNKAISLFSQTDVKVKIPSLVGGKDPDEIIKTYGRDKFKAMLEGASNEIEFALLSLRKNSNLNTTQGKLDFLNECIKVLDKTTPIEQDLYLSRLAEELGVEKRSIQSQLDSYHSKRVRNDKRREYKSIVEESVKTARKESYDASVSTRQIKAQDRLLGLLLLYPDCTRLCDKLNADALSEGFVRKVYDFIIAKTNDGLKPDLSAFGQILTDAEMGRLSGIIARSGDSTYAKKEFIDCIDVINSEYKKRNSPDISGMSDDDFRNLFKSNT
ncbi:MAG: DNA primase [Eubacteriales bacterium]|nr:DNA primase [Eubacteriales bacterium]